MIEAIFDGKEHRRNDPLSQGERITRLPFSCGPGGSISVETLRGLAPRLRRLLMTGMAGFFLIIAVYKAGRLISDFNY